MYALSKWGIIALFTRTLGPPHTSFIGLFCGGHTQAAGHKLLARSQTHNLDDHTALQATGPSRADSEE